MFIIIHLKKELYLTFLFLIIFVISKLIIEKEVELNYFMSLISRIFLIIFYLIEKYLSKSDVNKNSSSTINKIHLFPIQKIDNKKKPNLKLFLLILCYISYYLINQIVEKKYELKYDSYMYIKIIVLYFFNVISGEQIYIHHKLSIIIDSIIIIIIIIIYINDFIQKYIYIPYMLHSNYCYALYLFLIKYLNTNYYVSVFLLETFQGISLTIYYFIKRYMYLKTIFKFDIYILILYFLYSLMYNYFFVKAIEKLEPIHPVLTFLIGEAVISDLLKKNIYLYFLLSSIFIFSTLIYLEIIELNFLGLNKNYKNRITERSIDDVINISMNIFEKEDDNEK